MSSFELRLSHDGTDTQIRCSGDLSEQALDRIKEAVEIGLRRGSTSVTVHATDLGIRATSDQQDPQDLSALRGHTLRYPAVASYFLG